MPAQLLPKQEAKPVPNQAEPDAVGVLRCHDWASLVRCSAMNPTEAEKAKGERAKALLYWLMAVMIGVPAVIFFLRHVGL